MKYRNECIYIVAMSIKQNTSNKLDLLFSSNQLTKNDDKSKSIQIDMLYEQLCNPHIALKIIKDRDRFVTFNAICDFETNLDEILLTKLEASSDPQINNVFLVSPTVKCLNIYKMLNNIVCIEDSGRTQMWSGFNVEYEQRLQCIDLGKFMSYLWYDQLLNHNDGATVCKFKLEKYVRGILSKLNCLVCPDVSLIDKIVEHVQERYINDIDSIVSTGVNSFMSKLSLRESFRIYSEWLMIFGAVPYLPCNETDNATMKQLHTLNSCFSDDILKHVLSVSNKIPPISEVAVLLLHNEIECWHLPTKTKMKLLGNSKIRIEGKEVCLGTQGESMFYAELQFMQLAEKHFECQTLPKYILTEKVTKANAEHAKERQKLKNEIDHNSLFSTLSTSQDKNKNIKEYLSKLSSEVDEQQEKLNMFLDNISPEATESFVDELVRQGLESYLQKLKPKMDEWERTMKEHLNKFRIHAIKHMTTLPAGMYEFQERATQLNFNNNMDVEEFMEELSSNNLTKNKSMCNISDLQDFDKTGEDIKQMQEKVGQYFELATKFMGYLKNAQTVISNLKTSDSVKELQIKALTDQKKEMVKVARKFREASNKQLDIYRNKLKDVKKELEKFVHTQEETTSKTKRHFISIQDKLLSKPHLWDNKPQTNENVRENFLQQSFSKQYDSMTNTLKTPDLMDEIKFIEVEGTVRDSKLDRHVQDSTLMMFRENIHQLWITNLNTQIAIHKTVTQNGVQLQNVDEEQISQKYMGPFFQIIYDKTFFLVRKSLESCAKAYGMQIAIEVAVKKLIKLKAVTSTSTSETKVLTHTVTDNTTNEQATGLVLSN